jgi:hypothetical protein
MKQLEAYEPTGDDDIDTEWRAALQRRFAQIATERRAVDSRLAATRQGARDQGGGNAALLDLLPQGAIDPTLLSEEEQRDCTTPSTLQLRYDRPEAPGNAPSHDLRGSGGLADATRSAR